jgi:hypothetical protein
MSTELTRIIEFVHKNIENFYGVELTDREKQFMHVYYVMLELALETEKEDDESDSQIIVDELEESWNELMGSEDGYTLEDVCGWAENNVDTLFALYRQEKEVADMYRGLE